MEAALFVAIRLALYACLGLAFGLPLFALYGLAPADRAPLPLRGWLIGLGGLGLLGSVLGAYGLAATMSGVALAEVERSTIAALLAMPGVGDALLLRGAALAALLAAALLLRPAGWLAPVAASLGAVALGSLAWTGHAAATPGWKGAVHLAADVAHLFAAGAWLGAILAFGLLLRAARDTDRRLHAVLARFAFAGTLIVTLLVVTGAINLWALVGVDGLAALPGSTYGRLLIAKLALFAAMLGAAALNRFRLVPRLGADTPYGGRVLERSLAVELGLGAAVLAIVAWMGTLAPPAAA